MAKQITSKETNEHLENLCAWGGLLFIDKPVGITSRQVDSMLKRHIDFKKVGHIGTLDPFASGELVVCLGWATAATPFIEKRDKYYRVIIHFGLGTDSLDSQGKIIDDGYLTSATLLGQKKLKELEDADFAKLRAAINNLIYLKKQTPPIFSAIKYKGKPLYSYAREGKIEEGMLKDREISIKKVEIRNIRWLEKGQESALHRQIKDNYTPDREAVSPEVLDFSKNNPLIEAEIDIIVSKGTYIRSLCTHFSEQLNIAAYAASLRRISSSLPHQKTLLALNEALLLPSEKLQQKLVPITDFLDEYTQITLTSSAILALAKGKFLSLSDYEKEILQIENEQVRQSWQITKQILNGSETEFVLNADAADEALFHGKTMQSAPLFIGFVRKFEKNEQCYLRAERIFLRL